MTELANAELDAIERRAANASPAPWESSIEGRDHNTGGDSFIWIGDHEDDLQMYVLHTLPSWDPVATNRRTPISTSLPMHGRTYRRLSPRFAV